MIHSKAMIEELLTYNTTKTNASLLLDVIVNVIEKTFNNYICLPEITNSINIIDIQTDILLQKFIIYQIEKITLLLENLLIYKGMISIYHMAKISWNIIHKLINWSFYSVILKNRELSPDQFIYIQV
jgi:hypothetical protein